MRGVLRPGGGSFPACGGRGLAAERALSFLLFGHTIPGVSAFCRGGLGSWRTGIASARGAHLDLRRDSCAAGGGVALVCAFDRTRLRARLRGLATGQPWTSRKTQRAGGGHIGILDGREPVPAVCGGWV